MALRLEGLVKRFPGFQLGPLDLRLEAGARLAVVGPSGSGKTTLLRLVAGLARPDAGRIYLDGADVTGRRPWERDVALVFQSPALFPSFTVLENVVEPLLARGLGRREAEERALEALERLDLAPLARRYPPELSRGQQQRAALARALALRPRVLLLDEPLTALDPRLRDEVLPYLEEATRGRTTIYVTHDLEEASRMDLLLVLMGGRAAALGPTVEVMERPPTREAARFLGYVNSLPAECGELLFRPWDVRPGGPHRGRVRSALYSEGRYRAVVELPTGPVTVLWPEPPGDQLEFSIAHWVCL